VQSLRSDVRYEGDGVGGGEIVEHGLDEMREGQCAGHAEYDADEGEREAFTQDHAEYLTALRAEGHADADLRSAAGDVVGHDSIDADGGENESKEAEGSCELGEDPFGRESGCDLLIHGAEVGKREVAVYRCDYGADLREDRCGVGCGSHGPSRRDSIRRAPRQYRPG